MSFGVPFMPLNIAQQAFPGESFLPMILRQSSGHFSRSGGMGLGLYYPFILAISQ
jgi:hypothetical protein